MDVISSQGSSLLSVDLSYSDVTDAGLGLLKDCSNLQAMTLNYCDHFSERGLEHISGTSLFSLLHLATSVLKFVSSFILVDIIIIVMDESWFIALLMSVLFFLPIAV